MRRMHRIVLLAGLVALGPVLAGCADFDLDKLDVFGLNEKKKLPGDRRPLFPEGVPGVTQGIPPEFIKGSQPPPDAAQTPPAGQDAQAPATAPAKNTAAVEPAEEPKPKPKRKPKPRTTASAPAQSQSGGQQPQSAQSAWPAAGQQPAAGQGSSSAPWPSAPAPGTFQR